MVNQSGTIHYDAIVIGFGKAGKTLAGYMADNGLKVALVEKSPDMYGGTCINVACIPTKSLVKSAKQARDRRFADQAERADFYRAAIAEKSRLTAALNQKNYHKLNDNPNVTVYTGKGSFVSPTEVRVEMPDETLLLEGDRIIINTGSMPKLPDSIEGLRNNPRVYTNETLLEVTTLPEHLVIIGGGPIALEFASIYAGFGSRVTMLVRRDKLLPEDDDDLRSEIMQVLTDSGIDIRLGASTLSVSQEPLVTYKTSEETYELKASHVLAATGRVPNTEDLNLQAAGLHTDSTGHIETDAHLRTNVDNIWAVGDVKGGMYETYISLDDYRIVKSELDGQAERSTNNRGAIPTALFIEPAYARVGLNEREAKEQGLDFEVKKISAASIPYAQVLQQTEGVLKALVAPETGQILGAMLFCAESRELINQIKLAMDAKLPYTILRDAIYIHPCMSESFNDLFA